MQALESCDPQGNLLESRHHPHAREERDGPGDSSQVVIEMNSMWSISTAGNAGVARRVNQAPAVARGFPERPRPTADMVSAIIAAPPSSILLNWRTPGAAIGRGERRPNVMAARSNWPLTPLGRLRALHRTAVTEAATARPAASGEMPKLVALGHVITETAATLADVTRGCVRLLRCSML